MKTVLTMLILLAVWVQPMPFQEDGCANEVVIQGHDPQGYCVDEIIHRPMQDAALIIYRDQDGKHHSWLVERPYMTRTNWKYQEN